MNISIRQDKNYSLLRNFYNNGLSDGNIRPGYESTEAEEMKIYLLADAGDALESYLQSYPDEVLRRCLNVIDTRISEIRK